MGIEIDWKKNEVYVRQKGQKSRLLDNNNLMKCKLMSTPIATATEARENDENTLHEKDALTYCSIVGSLLHIAIKIRPGLCVAV